MSEEIFSYVRYWVIDMLPRLQVWHQSEAERYFDWYLEQIKQWDVEVSPVKREMHFLKDQDKHDYAIRYDQRVTVTGAEDVLQSLKDTVRTKR